MREQLGASTLDCEGHTRRAHFVGLVDDGALADHPLSLTVTGFDIGGPGHMYWLRHDDAMDMLIRSDEDSTDLGRQVGGHLPRAGPSVLLSKCSRRGVRSNRTIAIILLAQI